MKHTPFVEEHGWWCPSCGVLLAKPPKVDAVRRERWHSYNCNKPMMRASVVVYVPEMASHEAAS